VLSMADRLQMCVLWKCARACVQQIVLATSSIMRNKDNTLVAA
jgi:hypothetical protein